MAHAKTGEDVMASVRNVTRRYKAKMRTTFKGKIGTLDRVEAIYRGQELNASLAVSEVKARFSRRHRGSGHTADGFTSKVLSDGRMSVTNRRVNASRVEYGLFPFKGKGRKGQGRMLGLGREIGARNPGGVLVFWWERENRLFVGPYVVHPGQKPDPIVRDTMTDLADQFERNIRAEVGRSINEALGGKF